MVNACAGGIAAMGKNQHVLSHGERWAVKAEGAPEPVALFKTQSEAWEKAKSILGKSGPRRFCTARTGRSGPATPMATIPAAAGDDNLALRAEAAQGLKISAT